MANGKGNLSLSGNVFTTNGIAFGSLVMSDRPSVKKKTPELNVEYEAGLGESAANSLDK